MQVIQTAKMDIFMECCKNEAEEIKCELDVP